MWALPKQTVNSIVSNLVKKDLISLEVVSGTRNRKMIHPTEKGRAYGEAIILPIYHAEQQAFEGLSESERQTCITLLGKYILLLKEACNNEREVMP